ncbi:PaaX family transcriptional regulator C-terminal domain-containing protein [Planktotalea sp.]|uniref:PaaX family transcriptional regulator C-terminal domain-containing protein n=1 Tax=Planktotalea sp. TaxID=2029877 RepID=UPI003D6B8F61
MNDDAFQNAIRALCGNEAPRVWSFIVTIFGDLTQAQGDAISGPVLADILLPVGVRPEAMRVALHRLRNEGWLETSKRGREALHSLTPSGFEQSARASHRIYAEDHRAGPDWHVLCYPPALSSEEQVRAEAFAHQGYVAISSGVYLSNGELSPNAKDAFVIKGTIGDVPQWLSKALVPDALTLGFNDLSSALELATLTSLTSEDLSAIQIATLRALIVHRWRKLILKTPNFPDRLFGPQFEGTRCRAKVVQALSALPKPMISNLTRVGSSL